MPRSSPRPPLHTPGADSLEELEEIEVESVIAQRTDAHSPQRRVNVAEESRSVVISDLPPAPAGARPVRTSGDKTVIIRDRRALEDMRRHLVRRRAVRQRRSRAWFLWGALGVAAFVLGGAVAFFATAAGSEAITNDRAPRRARGQALPALSERVDTLSAPPPLPAAKSKTAAPSVAAASARPPRAVRLDDLPIERPSKR